MRILEFSGGKDSIACLMLLKDELHDITVLWADSGDAFPETVEQMEKVREMCPNFQIAKGNQPELIKENGYPADKERLYNASSMRGQLGHVVSVATSIRTVWVKF